MNESSSREGRRRPAQLTIREVVDGVRAELQASGLESAGVEAERLVAHVLELGRPSVSLGASRPFPQDRTKALADAVRRRIGGEPLQHIEGDVDFRTLTVLADGRALVPRPETEQLVELAAGWARTRSTAGGVKVVVGARAVRRSDPPPLDEALDIGTGSGVIALSLLAERIASSVVAIDRSAAALEQAQENARRVGVGAALRLKRVTDDLWNAVGPSRFDLIVSNPPYVPDSDLPSLQVEVRDHDPVMALAGGPDGLDLVRDIVAGAAEHLHPGGALCLELGEGQPPVVAAILAAGPWDSISTHRDLAGRERFVLAVRA